jgi:hypothetical protein
MLCVLSSSTLPGLLGWGQLEVTGRGYGSSCAQLDGQQTVRHDDAASAKLEQEHARHKECGGGGGGVQVLALRRNGPAHLALCMSNL